MADRELIAAILTAGMLPTLEIPQSRAYGSRGRLAVGEAESSNAPLTTPSVFTDWF
jgi:hypothetical protein